MSEEYYSDYPTEPMGKGNPYSCCALCGVSAPAINGQLKNHAEWCGYRKEKEKGETEIANLPVTLYRTENGKHICSSDWTEGKRCPFLMLSRMGTLEHCFFDSGAGLQRDEDGYGWLIPSEKCPLVEVSK